MARADTVTKLPLDTWAKIIGLNPLHFNGLYDPNRQTSPCQQPWMQFAWQAADRVSRDEVAIAIATAEANIEALLKYRLLPSWETEEWVEAARPYKPELYNSTMTDIRGKRPTLQARWGYFVSGGIRASTLVDDAVAIAASDPDSDGFNELATVTVAVTAGQAPCELRVYFPGHAGDPAFEIRPATASVSGLVGTITFPRVQAVQPALYDDIAPPVDDSHHRGVSAGDAASFVTTVDVYRVYNDPQTQATLLWEGNGCGCGTGSCETCSFDAQTACLLPRGDPRQSVLAYSPATWDADTEDFTANVTYRSMPDSARLFYYAGWRDQNQDCPNVQLDPDWARAVAYYAASLLDRPICECNNIRSWVEHWQRDLAVASREQEAIGQISPSDLDCPLGTRRGALYAWRRILAAGPIATPVLALQGGA